MALGAAAALRAHRRFLAGSRGQWKQRRVDAYVQRLRNEPGVVVTGVERRDGRVARFGFARSSSRRSGGTPDRSRSLDPARVVGHWESYQALNPAMVLKRFTATLDPPRGVSFSLDGDVIRAERQRSAALGRNGRGR